MTENEIVRDYREAKNKREQITILSDLNRCGKEEIIDILIRNGVNPEEFSRTRKSKSKQEEERRIQSASDTVASILALKVMEIDNDLQKHYAAAAKLEREKADIMTYIKILA